MALFILLGIILVPLVEIAVFIMVGDAIGIIPTILLTVLTAVAGTIMLRQQGLSLVMRMQSELDAGRVPGEDLMHGAMIVIASLLLLLPGFVTDAIGLLLFVPPIRDMLARYIVSRSNVVIVQSGTSYRRQDGVVDLDEDDWSRKEGEPDTDGQNPPQISPWNSENDRP